MNKEEEIQLLSRRLKDLFFNESDKIYTAYFLFFIAERLKGFPNKKNETPYWFRIEKLIFCHPDLVKRKLEILFQDLGPMHSEVGNIFERQIEIAGKNPKGFLKLLFELFPFVNVIREREKISASLIDNYMSPYLVKSKGLFVPNPNPKLIKLLTALPEFKDKMVVFNPSCGFGRLLTSINEKSKIKLRLIGEEINEETYLICKMLFLLDNINIDYLSNRNSLHIEGELSVEENKHLDKSNISLSISPFGKLDKSIQDELSFVTTIPVSSQETAFAAMMIATLRENGRAYLTVPESLLISSRYKKFRQRCLELGILEAVISLPKGALEGTKGRFSILVLARTSLSEAIFIDFKGDIDSLDENDIDVISKTYKLAAGLIEGDVRRIGITSSLHKVFYTVASYDEIRSQFVSFNARLYNHKSYNEIKDLVENAGKTMVSLQSLVKGSELGKMIDNFRVDKIDSNTSIPYIQTGDLTRKQKESELDLAQINKAISRKDEEAAKILRETAILVSTVSSDLRATLFTYEDIPIVIGSRVLALIPREDIDPIFLLYQLKTKFTEVQAELFRTGSVTMAITQTALSKILIPLPDEDERNRLTLEAKSRYEEQIKLIDAREEKEEAVTQAEVKVVATIAHNYNQKLGGIVTDLDTLFFYLEKKSQEKSIFDINEPIAPIFPGEDTTATQSVKAVVDRIDRNIKDAVKTFKTTQDILSLNKLNKQPQNLRQFLESVKADFHFDNCEVKIKGKTLNFNFDQDALKDAIRNLLENAVKHGFIDDETQYNIEFKMSKVEDIETNEELVRILYRNDGKSFPEDFDFKGFIAFGSRAGVNRGTGLGGFFINKVIELHGGEFKQITAANELEEFNVGFVISLPLN